MIRRLKFAGCRGLMQGMVLHDLAIRGINYHVVSGGLEQRVATVRAVLNTPSRAKVKL